MGAALARKVFVPPAPEPQRIDIEDLLGWTYRIQQADCAGNLDGGGYGMTRTATAIVCDMLAGGMVGSGTVPCAGSLFVVHPDARRVHNMVMASMEVPVALLLMEHARQGTQPGWFEGVEPYLVMKPRRDARTGQPIWNFKERRAEPAIVWIDKNGNATPEAAKAHNYGYCEVEEYPSGAFIEAARETYRIWWRAMRDLTIFLEGAGLERWVVSGPRAPYEPWEKQA